MAREKTKFETFLDGLCSIWKLDESKKPVLVLENIRFQNRVVGYKRNYSAEQAQYHIERMIRIPRADHITQGAFVTIGDNQYSVIQAQPKFDTIPHCTDLTLGQPEILLEFDPNWAGSGGRF